MHFEEALAYLGERRHPSDPNYRAACEVVADNLHRLPYRVFIHLPGGLDGNSDPAWDNIKAASEECCSCGNERVFEPRDMRHEFDPSVVEPIVLSVGDTLYIRPIGAPASAAYTKYELVQTTDGFFLSYMADPMSSSINFSSLFQTQGFYLASLVEPLERGGGQPAVIARDLKHIKRIPLVGISAVDPEAGTVTLILDAAVEAFDPDEEEPHTH
jgi:hypothetical protein